jgi:pimeloyl-ACP methyl ester carboxylesterase
VNSVVTTEPDVSGSSTPSVEGKPSPPRARFFLVAGIIAVAFVLTIGSVIAYALWGNDDDIAKAQAQLQPFYTPPADIPIEPGSIIRSEEIENADVPGGKAVRILYTSQDEAGKPVAVSGMIFVPDKAAPREGREVLAWAHGTVGLADQCAPSRRANPLGDTQNWLDVAMDRNYVVPATDYLGLGTPGPNTYLIPGQEARDVVNSVRAARNFEQAKAGKRWIVWGHSQGGHSSLWTGTLAKEIAPELDLIAVGAAAPAAELTTIVARQWDQVVGWVIGPYAMVSLSDAYPDRDFRSVVSSSGMDQLDSIMSKCTQAGGIEGLASKTLGSDFFRSDPNDVPSWAQTITDITPRPYGPELPLFMSEGTADEIVLSGSNALMQDKWCKAGSDLTVEWLGGVGHMQVAIASGPTFMEWAVDRFAGKPTTPNCAYPPASPPFPAVELSPEVLAAPITLGVPVSPVPSESPSPIQ